MFPARLSNCHTCKIRLSLSSVAVAIKGGGFSRCTELGCTVDLPRGASTFRGGDVATGTSLFFTCSGAAVAAARCPEDEEDEERSRWL